MIYPLIYFPLTTPVLLAAMQASLLALDPETVSMSALWAGPARSWAGLLLAFDVIYLTLGVLLYGELVDET
jgi:hypothetical protein